jgi:hypothetical protein
MVYIQVSESVLKQSSKNETSYLLWNQKIHHRLHKRVIGN